jgi:Txe/YoeB family toxin of Txe-Axe toxin-antitoxin module
MSEPYCGCIIEEEYNKLVSEVRKLVEEMEKDPWALRYNYEFTKELKKVLRGER